MLILYLFALLMGPVPVTVFAGDSIMHAGPWSKLCPGAVVIAKPSGTTRDILDRLPDILAAKPATVVLMIGVNDIALGVPTDETIRNVAAIKERLEAAGARVLLHEVLPVTEAYPRPGYNPRIDAINAMLPPDRIALRIPPKLYMGDGIHLRGGAYLVWAADLRRHGVCSRCQSLITLALDGLDDLAQTPHFIGQVLVGHYWIPAAAVHI